MSLELSESDMEEIISKHPEIVEGDLMLKGRQVYVSGMRIDLLFVDKFGDRLIVELKKGTVTRSHVAQLMEYSGAIPEEQRSVTRVMLVANVVPPRWKKALDVHGIEYRELNNRDYIEFLKEKDPKLLERLQKKLSQPIGPPERALPRSREPTRITTAGHKYGILWSHNIQKHPGWLSSVAKAIEYQGFIWWDVGWRVKAGLFPSRTTGFICSKGLITHEASIALIIRQPNEKQVMEVAENFEKLYELGIYRPLYDRKIAHFYQYWKGKKKSLTLLKITELRRLSPQRSVASLRLAKTEEAVKDAPEATAEFFSRPMRAHDTVNYLRFSRFLNPGRIVVRKETHIRLADQIASEIGLSEEATYLRKGSVVPDDWKNYPHHYGKGGSIRNYIMNSRKALLRGEKETACHHLGVAFHYLADKWTLMSGSDSRHASWERSIEKSTFIDEIDVILESASVSDEDKRGYRSLFRKLDRKPVGRDETLWLASLSRPSNWSIPSIDLNIVYTICLKIARSVFSSVIPSPEILKQIEELGKE